MWDSLLARTWLIITFYFLVSVRCMSQAFWMYVKYQIQFFCSCQGDHFRRIQVCTDHKLHLQHIPRSNHKMLKSCWCHQRCTNGPHTEPQVTREPCAQWRSRCEWCHCLVPHLTGSGSVLTRLWLCARPVALCSPAVHQWAVDKIAAKLPVFIYGKCLNNCVRYRLQVRNNSDGCFSSASVLGGD